MELVQLAAMQTEQENTVFGLLIRKTLKMSNARLISIDATG